MSNLSTFQTLACKVRLNVSSAKTSKKDLRSFNYRQIVDRLQCHLNDSVDSYVVIIVPISHLTKLTTSDIKLKTALFKLNFFFEKSINHSCCHPSIVNL